MEFKSRFKIALRAAYIKKEDFLNLPVSKQTKLAKNNKQRQEWLKESKENPELFDVKDAKKNSDRKVNKKNVKQIHNEIEKEKPRTALITKVIENLEKEKPSKSKEINSLDKFNTVLTPLVDSFLNTTYEASEKDKETITRLINAIHKQIFLENGKIENMSNAQGYIPKGSRRRLEEKQKLINELENLKTNLSSLIKKEQKL